MPPLRCLQNVLKNTFISCRKNRWNTTWGRGKDSLRAPSAPARWNLETITHGELDYAAHLWQSWAAKSTRMVAIVPNKAVL